MKIEAIFLLLLIASVPMLMPVISSDYEITLSSRSSVDVLYNLDSPSLTILSSENEEFSINVTSVSEDDTQGNLVASGENTLKLELEDMNQGYYIISLFSERLNEVRFETQGIFLESLIIITILAIINIGFLVRRYLGYA